jgi:hypothetical protein
LALILIRFGLLAVGLAEVRLSFVDLRFLPKRLALLEVELALFLLSAQQNLCFPLQIRLLLAPLVLGFEPIPSPLKRLLSLGKGTLFLRKVE